MTKRISEEERNEIKRLYDDGNGLTPTEIAKKKGMFLLFCIRFN